MNKHTKISQLENILIVDDQPENLQVLAKILTEKGYKVRKALNGNMALRAINSTPPHLILLDIRMPEIDGYQVCQQLQSNPKTGDIPIIFLSALSEVVDKVKAFDLGGVDYITKPFQVEEVLARVQTQLKLRQQKQQLQAHNLCLQKEIIKRQKAETNLRLFHQAIAYCSNGVVITDATQPDYPIIYVNNAFEKITGYSSPEVIGKNPRFLQGKDQDQPGLQVIREALVNQTDCCVMLRNYRKDSSLYWNELHISPVRNSDGKVTHYIGIKTDITDRKKIEEVLQLSEAKFSVAFQASPDVITISTLKDGRYLEVNEAFCQLSGYSKEEAINHTAIELNIWVNLKDRDGLKTLLEISGKASDLELEFRTKSGEIKTLLLSAGIIEINKEPCLLAVGKDITERKQIQLALEKYNQELYRLATLDSLTQISNRHNFNLVIEQSLNRCKREKQPLSLILCDVDHFKAYNDHYGHLLGDDCLIEVAQAINSIIHRAGDLVARYGGEEFAVILPNTDSNGAMKIAQLICEKIKNLKIPHPASKVNQFVTLSLGVTTLIPAENIALKVLIDQADQALYQAKGQGRDRIVMAGIEAPGLPLVST